MLTPNKRTRDEYAGNDESRNPLAKRQKTKTKARSAVAPKVSAEERIRRRIQGLPQQQIENWLVSITRGDLAAIEEIRELHPARWQDEPTETDFSQQNSPKGEEDSEYSDEDDSSESLNLHAFKREQSTEGYSSLESTPTGEEDSDFDIEKEAQSAGSTQKSANTDSSLPNRPQEKTEPKSTDDEGSSAGRSLRVYLPVNNDEVITDSSVPRWRSPGPEDEDEGPTETFIELSGISVDSSTVKYEYGTAENDDVTLKNGTRPGLRGILGYIRDEGDESNAKNPSFQTKVERLRALRKIGLCVVDGDAETELESNIFWEPGKARDRVLKDVGNITCEILKKLTQDELESLLKAEGFFQDMLAL